MKERKRKCIRRLLAAVMCLLMTVSMMPVNVYADGLVPAFITPPGDAGSLGEYGIWIGGTQVTDANKDNLPNLCGVGASGTYDPVSKILTFNDVTGIKGYKTGTRYLKNVKSMIYIKEGSVVIDGNLSIYNTSEDIDYIIYSDYNSVEIRGDVKIATGAKEDAGFAGECSLCITGKLGIQNTNEDEICTSLRVRDLLVQGGTVTIDNCNYAMYVDNINMTSGEIDVRSSLEAAIHIERSFLMDGGKVNAYSKEAEYAIDANQSTLCNRLVMRGGSISAETEEGTAAIYVGNYPEKLGHSIPEGYEFSIDDKLQIIEPAGGKLNDGKSCVINATGEKAKKVVIGPVGNYHNVVFSMNGVGTAKLISPQYVNDGQKAIKPEQDPSCSSSPKKEFKGWYKDQGCTEEFDFNNPITKDTTIYAGWLTRYYVGFDLKGHGSQYIEVQTVNAGEKATMPEKPLDPVYSFMGWYTDWECSDGNEFDFNTPITKTMVLYAKWEKSKSIEDAEIVVQGGPFVYSNSGVNTPDVTVTLGGTVLTKDTDYTVKYVNNCKPGKAQVVVTGAGTYVGERSVDFTIEKGQLTFNNAAIFNFNEISSGKSLWDVDIKPSAGYSAFDEGEHGKDGIWVWDEDEDTEVKANTGYKALFIPYDTLYAPLEHTFVLTNTKGNPWFDGKYIDARYCKLGSEFDVDFSEFIVDDILDGQAIQISNPDNFVESLLLSDKKLHVKYASTATNEVKAQWIMINVPESQTYQAYSVGVKLYLVTKEEQTGLSFSKKLYEIEYGDNTKSVYAEGGLSSPVTYSDGGSTTWFTVDANTGKITPKSRGKATIYAETPEVTVDATEYDKGHARAIVKITKANIANADIELSANEFPFDGEAKEPGVTVTYKGDVLTDNDYKVVYSNNINAGTASVKVYGIGNFKGTAEKTFTIKPIELKLVGATAVERYYQKDNKEVTLRNLSFTKGGEVYDFGAENYTVIGQLADDKAGTEKPVTVVFTMRDTNYSVNTTEAVVKVDIYKNTLSWVSPEVSSEIGKETSVDLSSYIEEGGTPEIVPEMLDNGGLFAGDPTLENNVLKFTITDDEQYIGGDGWPIIVAVRNAVNYKDYTIAPYIKITAKTNTVVDDQKKDESSEGDGTNKTDKNTETKTTTGGPSGGGGGGTGGGGGGGAVEDKPAVSDNNTKPPVTTVSDNTAKTPEKGDAVAVKTDSGDKVKAVYTVTDPAKKEVSYSLPEGTKVKNLTIPATVTAEDDTVYTVTEIPAGAFKGATDLKKIIIGSNITKIDENAFDGCDKVKVITIDATNLKTVDKNALKGVNKKAKIIIKAKDKKTYKKLVKKFKKAGAKKATFKFKKVKTKKKK